jgi:urease accessory protein
VRAQYLLEKPWEIVVMDSAERHLRRKLITLQQGDEVLVDLEKPIKFADRDCLILEDGRLVQIIASDEELLEITARDASHLTQLAWHIGNRHLEAQIEATRILIRRDHVIAKMLEQLGAHVTEVCETFIPEHGAYAHGH